MVTSRTAVYSGTFDPFTLGHDDVVRRAAGLFDRLVIAVAAAHHKKTLFSLEARVAQVQAATRGIAGVTVLPFDGLIMDFCAAHHGAGFLRGAEIHDQAVKRQHRDAGDAPGCGLHLRHTRFQ